MAVRSLKVYGQLRHTSNYIKTITCLFKFM
jgi:hypothetical protein